MKGDKKSEGEKKDMTSIASGNAASLCTIGQKKEEDVPTSAFKRGSLSTAKAHGESDGGTKKSSVLGFSRRGEKRWCLSR
jgi:hypothetical protein